MSDQFEVPEPIICSPYEEPSGHWRLEQGQPPTREPGRRPAHYFYRDPARQTAEGEAEGVAVPLPLVNLVRERLNDWHAAGYPGATRTTLELLNYWRRDGRQHRLFFAQIEAAETIIFLTEARRDFLRGIDIPSDEPSDKQRTELGYRAFRRCACKMATGSGKTTVMALLSAWSILNKVHDRGNARYSDVVLVVCPNVTIRSRLHRHREGAVRVAGREPAAHGRAAASHRRVPEHTGSRQHDPRGLEGRARDRHRPREIGRSHVDALHPGHRGQNRLADGPSGAHGVPRGLRGAGGEARRAPAPARP